MSIRTAQKLVTRQRILDAVLDLVAEGELTEVTVPDVARRSGASVATIYRYFPSKDVLFEAAASEPALRAAGPLPDRENGGADGGRVLAAAVDRVRAEHVTAAPPAGVRRRPRDAGGQIRGVAALVRRRSCRAGHRSGVATR